MKTNNNPTINSSLYGSKDNKSLYATLIVLFTLWILFFGTTSIYSNYMEHSTQKAENDKKIIELTQEYTDLETKKRAIDSDNNFKKSENQFAGVYREDTIIDEVYAKIPWITIGWISMDKWQKLSTWLSMANISFNIDATWIDDLEWYLKYLTLNVGEKSSKKGFVIKSISIPLNTSIEKGRKAWIQAWVNLGMYYFDK